MAISGPGSGLDHSVKVVSAKISSNKSESAASQTNALLESACTTDAAPLPSDLPERAQRLADMATDRQRGTLLHVGCGAYAQEKLPPVFRHGWREIRLDINPDVSPDFVASITNMDVIANGDVDAVYSSHNLEHLYPHEVALALAEMHRVLKPEGFALITLPDLREVARHVADGKLEEPLYLSPMGPIAPLDILYGHRTSLAKGNLFMAHRTGFTDETLAAALVHAGFAAVLSQRNVASFSLTAIGFRARPDKAAIAAAQALMLPDAQCPCTLYERPRSPR